EERQAYLLGEIGHRTKNLIAVVSSLVNQTARTSSSVEDMATNLNGRLGAVSASQSELTNRPSGQALDLAQLCRCQMRAFLANDDDRLRMNGPELLMPSEVARSIGMAIYE